MRLNLKGTSDKIVWRMIQVWFAGVIFGGVIVLAEVIAALVTAFSASGYASVTVHLSEYLMYVGAPVSGGIVTALIKNAMENREKIRANPEYLKNKEREETNHEWNEH